jgi:hypothetical protein
MKTLLKNLSIILLVILGISLNSCVKQQFDVPPSNCDTLDTIQANITIKQLKQMLPVYQDTLKITDDLIIEGYVISNDQYGNFYKELVIQDTTAGISILLDQTYLYTVYPQGQKIIVKLKGLYLGRQYGVVKLGSTYDDNGITRFGRIQGQEVIDLHLLKTCINQPQKPLTISIDQINDDLLYRYVQLSPVQFTEDELGTTWANPYADPPQAVNHHLIDTNGNSIIVRTSGYASFAAEPIPEGSGTFVAILGKYNNDYQLYVNSPKELDMSYDRFTLPINILKDFSDGSLSSGGWRNINVSGSIDWAVSSKYGNPAPGITISNWTGSAHVACETWYVSPSLDLSSAVNPVFSFDNANGYSGDWLTVAYSTDWDGNPTTISSATWTTVTFASDQSSTYWVWVNSGEISLPKQQNVYIAFIYKGTDNDGMTWEIDNIHIYDKR